MNIIQELYDKKITNLGGHAWIYDNCQYITMMGSVAYGSNSDTSDIDIYSFCIPRREDVFPHLKGEIVGFGEAKHNNNRFRNLQLHHIVCEDKIYDLNIYNIVDYFQSIMENNPNILDSLFTPQFCVLYSTKVGQMVREKRKMFLHLGAWHTFKGYAYAQLSKSKNKIPTGKRKESFDKIGYDVKSASHLVRLLNQVEQILVEGDVDLQRCREQIKSIRRGEWTFEQVKDFFTRKEIELETLYAKNQANLPFGPNDCGLQEKCKQLLINCLEEHYGSLNKCFVDENAPIKAMREINEILQKNRNLW